MKKAVLLISALVFSSVLLGGKPAAQCDKFSLAAGKLKNKKAALELINKAVECYETEMKKEPSPEIIMRYADALDLKYGYLAEDKYDSKEKKQAYKKLIDEIEKYCVSHKGCEDSAEINYAKAMMWGRYAELLSAWEAATEGAADKIKESAEKLLEIDPAFHDHIALITLGRMHFMAPNILFVMTWPDKGKSKEYLTRFLEKKPGSLTGMLYLADTLWSIGEKKEAAKLYFKVAGSGPSDEAYFKDLLAIKLAKQEIKKLNLESEN